MALNLRNFYVVFKKLHEVSNSNKKKYLKNQFKIRYQSKDR
jgi:hypothetical protein